MKTIIIIMNKSIFVNDNDLEKMNTFLKKPDKTKLNKILEFIEIFNDRTDTGFNNGIKINLSFDIPDNLKIPEPVEPLEKVRKVRCDKGVYFCKDCDKHFNNNFLLDRHKKSSKHYLNLIKDKYVKIGDNEILDFN